MQYSPFSKRLFAMIFDLALINVIISIVAQLLLPDFGFAIDPEKLAVAMEASEQGGNVDMNFIQQTIIAGLILSLLSVLVVIVFDAVLPATKLMGSPGKAVLGMAIVDADGQRISFMKAFARHAAKFISAITLFGFLMPLWNPKRQALHDKMTATYVVKKKGLVA